MTHFPYPLHDRLLREIRQWLNDTLDRVRSPLRRSSILLVTGHAPDQKVSEVENRLRFLFAHLGRDFDFRIARRASLVDYLRNTAVVAVDGSAIPASVSKHLRWVADLDYETNPTDGWALIDLGVAIRGPQHDVAAAARRTLVDRVERIRATGARPVYLFGTGPSLQSAGDRSFADGTTIVCNTIVRDTELWNHLAPDFLVAGDAIYHFGQNPHSCAFRADALQRLRESDGRTLFMYPAQYDVIVRPEFADVESLLVPIPFGTHSDPAVDLTRHFGLPRLENVLANLLLPLGCTISRDVRLWGFDGRAPSDSGFWANSDRHSYPELMQSIRDAHPAFFADKIPKGNEIQYVNKAHGDLLDNRLMDAEQRGFTFRMLHPSWTPTLQKRFHEETPDAEGALRQSARYDRPE